MKKSLLIVACASVCLAAVAEVSAPTVYPGLVISGISPDGSWAASSDETSYTFTVINLASGETYGYGAAYGTDDMMSGGLGKYVSNNGIVVASSYETDMPYYWEAGEWRQLPVRPTDFGAAPNAISADGSLIVGHVTRTALTTDDVGTMAVPVIWSRNASGGYDPYVALDYPRTDWTGRTPQYVLLDDVSADGRTIAGDVVDYSGFNNEPIVYTLGEDGKWQYKLLAQDLINPGNVEFPEYPGDAPNPPETSDYMTPEEAEAYDTAVTEYNDRPYPYLINYMTDEELEAYEDALEAYMEDDTLPYPEMVDYVSAETLAKYEADSDAYWAVKFPEATDFMTDEELDAYNAAFADFEVKFELWADKYAAFEEKYIDALTNPAALTFTMNSAHVSANGRYYVMGANVSYDDPESWTGVSTCQAAYLFDLVTGERWEMSEGVTDIMATQVMDDGAILGASDTDKYDRRAVIAHGPGMPWVYLSEDIESASPTLYDWVKEHMEHTVVNVELVYDPATDTFTEKVTNETKIITGTPVATSDMSLIATWTFRSWEEDGPDFYSYILPTEGKLSGITGVAGARGMSVAISGDGVLSVTSDVMAVEIFDLNGRRVYSTSAPQGAITGLRSGMYIIRATGADGSTVVSKVPLR